MSPSLPPSKRSPQVTPPERTLEDAENAADIPPPTGLAASVLEAGSEEYAVLSFPLRPMWTAPGLTPAERAVIEALLTGVSAAQIAAERGTSVRTVRNQIRSAYVKLGVSSRGALARLYASMVK